MSMPIGFGIINDENKIYMILSWMEGREASDVLSCLSLKAQYDLGIEAGKILRKIHTIPAPCSQQDWSMRYNKKLDRNLKRYRNCGIKFIDDDKLIQYIEDNRYLLDNREQTIQHGDYHTGNMIISNDNKLGIIDFNRWDYGDPWEEFNRIILSYRASKEFACGQIDGYFDGLVPDDFFKLTALYIAANCLSSIPWAIRFGQDEIDIMRSIANQVLHTYRQFTCYVPIWYEENSYNFYHGG